MERELSLIRNLIEQHNLNLKGLKVLCECASGPYSYTPAIIALAGGTPYNIGKDTSYGSFEENKQRVTEIMNKVCPSSELFFYKDYFPDNVISEADIIPNIGFVRPIDKRKISLFKSTAVVPLMWETWEFRVGEVDIKYCLDRDIPVAGTDESKKINMFGYNGLIALKLLFEMGLEGYNNKVVLLGSGHTASSMYNFLSLAGVKIKWFSSDTKEKNLNNYSSIYEIFNEDHLDAIIIAEHMNDIQLLGNDEDSLLDIFKLQEKFPSVKIGHICGNINSELLKKSAIYSYPEKIFPFGYMSFQAFHLGPQPVIELNILGLKVGEIMTKARLAGLSIEAAIKAAVDSEYGQDFDGGFKNFASLA